MKETTKEKDHQIKSDIHRLGLRFITQVHSCPNHDKRDFQKCCRVKRANGQGGFIVFDSPIAF